MSTSRVYPIDPINGLNYEETGSSFDLSEKQAIKGASREGISEEFSLEGARSLYGTTKLASELLLQEYVYSYNLKGVINRCGVIAGPWQFGKVDQGVFTYWMLAHYFKKGLKYIGFGGQGKQVRDLLHVNDLFELIDKEIDNLSRINGNIYNVGGGRDISLSLLEATWLCQKITGNKVKIGRGLKARAGDIAIYLSDSGKIGKDLGWKPRKLCWYAF